jgi:hypothetical protein
MKDEISQGETEGLRYRALSTERLALSSVSVPALNLEL